MAYSDYGGYAFRNGVRIEARSDAVLTTEGIKSSPGMWPGFVIPEGRSGGSFHVLLGDGPIHVGLCKQSTVTVFKDGAEIDPLTLGTFPEEAIYKWSDGTGRSLDPDYYKAQWTPCVLTIDGWTITIHWLVEDNHFQFVKVQQPDGTLWHGWSGYGVGAGLEDSPDHGGSTEMQNIRLLGYWPEAIK